MERNNISEFISKSLHKKKLVFGKNDFLFHEGDDANGIYVVTSGNAKIVKKSSPDTNLILHIADSGALLGIHAVVNMHKHTYSAIALSKTFAYLIPRNEFLRIVKENSPLKLTVMKILCSNIDLLESKINSRSDKSASERLADTLISLIETYGVDKNGCIKLELPLRDLAGLIGASPDYLNKKIKEFRENGLISDKSGRIQILDPVRLEKIAHVKQSALA